MDKIRYNTVFCSVSKSTLLFLPILKKEKKITIEGGRALFFINLPAFMVELGLEDQEVHTIPVPWLLWYFTSVKKQKMPEYFLGILSSTGI